MSTVHIDTVEISTESGAVVIADIRYNDATGNWYARYLDGGLGIEAKRQIVSSQPTRADVDRQLNDWASKK